MLTQPTRWQLLAGFVVEQLLQDRRLTAACDHEMNLLSRKDLLEPQGDRGLGHALRISSKETSVLLTGGRRKLHDPASHQRAAGRFVEPHMTVAAQPQQLEAHTTRCRKRLLVSLRRCLWIDSIRLWQAQLLRAKAEGLAACLLYTSPSPRDEL